MGLTVAGISMIRLEEVKRVSAVMHKPLYSP